MKKDEFESTILDLWIETDIPLTLANIQYQSGVPHRKASKWLDQMVQNGQIEIDSSDDGEIVYKVPGARRPKDGPRTFAERDRLASLKGQVQADLMRKKAKLEHIQARARKEREKAEHRRLARGQDPRTAYDAGTALAIVRSTSQELAQGPGAGKKSLLVSGGLSLVLGPLGWLYAGSYRDAIPAGAAYLLALSIIPKLLLLPILGIAMPISAVAGLVYAWQYNRTGQRGSLFGRDDDE